MTTIEVRTQSALDEAIAAAGPGDIIAIRGDGVFYAYDSAQVRAYGSAQVTASDSAQVRASDSAQVRAYGSAQVTAYDSAQVRASGSAQVTAYDSAQVRAYDSAQVRAYDSAQVTASGSAQVRAYDSAQVRAYDSAQVMAYDSAQVRASGSAQVRAYDSAQVTASGSAQVRASGSAQVRASDSAQVMASKYVAVTIHGTRCTIKGGVQIKLPALDTPAAWCEYHGVRVVKGVATLYKAVADDWTTPYSARAGIAYAPGATVEAPDWEPTPSCGAGLHAVPHTVDGLAYYPEATRYVAVTAPLDSLVVIDDDKVKAPRLTVKGEVTADGRPVRKAAAK